MSNIDLLKANSKNAKRIRVKVESIDTGEVVKDFDCGTDQKRADKLENSLFERTNLEKYYVYQSIER